MSSLVAPRYELPLIDPASGRMSREWYQFLVRLSKAVGESPTSSDDVQLLDSTQSGDAMALSALNTLSKDILALYPLDPIPAVDTSILAWWPGDQK